MYFAQQKEYEDMGWVFNLKDSNGPTSAPRFIAVITSLTIIALVTVCLRLYVRIYLMRGFGSDDLAIIFSIVMSCGYSTCDILQTRWGQGLTAANFPLQNAYEFSLIQYAGSPFYTMGLLGFKLALLLAYLRVGGFNQVHRITIYVVLAATVLNQLVFTCLLMFSCHPIAFQWDTSIEGGYCINEVPPFYALAGTTLFFDLVIIALPLPILLRLQLETRRKVALIAVFALGFFITIIQVIRMNYIKNLKTYTDSETIILWSSIEINLGILVSCIPTLSPLFRYFTTMNSSARKSSSHIDDHTSPSSHTYTNPQRNEPHSRHSWHLRKANGDPYAFHTNTSTLNNAANVMGNVFHMEPLSKNVGVAIEEDAGWDRYEPRTSQVGISRTSVHGHVPVPSGACGDNESEEYIIGDGIGIRATTEVRVEFGERSGFASAGASGASRKG